MALVGGCYRNHFPKLGLYEVVRKARLGGRGGRNDQVLVVLDAVVVQRLQANEDCFAASESRCHRIKD
jgi:hypothetical protein